MLTTPHVLHRRHEPQHPIAAACPDSGITIYGHEQDEAALFSETAPRFGVMPTITDAPASEATVELARRDRYISIGHKTGSPTPRSVR